MIRCYSRYLTVKLPLKSSKWLTDPPKHIFVSLSGTQYHTKYHNLISVTSVTTLIIYNMLCCVNRCVNILVNQSLFTFNFLIILLVFAHNSVFQMHYLDSVRYIMCYYTKIVPVKRILIASDFSNNSVLAKWARSEFNKYVLACSLMLAFPLQEEKG